MTSNTAGGPTRRERMRAETIAEIKSSARGQLIEKGVKGISLRAIAREVGVSPAALYRYFDSLEDLIADLCCDFWDELIGVTVKAMENEPPGNHLARMKTWVWTFRSWSISHKSEFEIMFNTPEGLPNRNLHAFAAGQPEELDAMTEKAMEHARLCGQEFGLFWQQLQREGRDVQARVQLAPLSPGLAEEVRACSMYLAIPDEIPIGWVYRFMSAWVRVFGMVVMEAYGATPVKENIDEFYKVEVTSMIAELLGDYEDGTGTTD